MISSRVPLPFRIVVAQCIATGVLALLWLLATPAHSIASVMAGLAVAVPNAFFAWRVAVRRTDSGAVHEARRIVASSMAKLMLGIGLLVAIFVAYRPEPVAFFVTLIAVQIVHAIAPLLDVPRRVASDGRT